MLHRVFPRAWLLGGACACALASSLSAQGTQGGTGPAVEQVDFVGVHSVDVDRLRASIATQPSRCRSALLTPLCAFHVFVDRSRLDRLELSRDLLRIRVFYWRRGYRETQVDTAVIHQDDGARVIFRVTEGPPTIIKTLAIVSPHVPLTPERSRAILLVHAGDPLDLLAIDSSLVLLRNTLGDGGYADASVRDTILVADTGRSARVRITIRPGARTTVGRVEISGNSEISNRTITNMLSVKPGDILRRGDLVASQRNLYQSNLFRRAAITIPPSPDSAKVMDVTVQEAAMHEARVSFGFNTVDFFQVEGRFSDYNWRGKARRLELRAVVGNLLAPQLNGRFPFDDVTPTSLTGAAERIYLDPNWTASADLAQPFFHSPRNSLGLSFFAHRQSAPAVFIDRGVGASASFTHQLGQQSPATLAYRFEITEVEAGDIYFCVNFGVCQFQTIAALRGRHALSPLSIGILANRTNDAINPTRGYQAELDLEHASAATLSDYRYNRVSGSLSTYIPAGGQAVLAGHVQVGWVHALPTTNRALGVSDTNGVPIIHPRKRFYAGGAQSVRGYGENQLGPRILTIDPARLTDTTLANPCTVASIADGSCNPNGAPSGDFLPRPLGGNALIEGSLEYRFPLAGKVGGAVFVDAAIVGENGLTDFSAATAAVTPGFGVRYYSPFGPIRMDLGIRPNLTEHLPVITQIPDSTGPPTVVRLDTQKLYNPLEGSGSGIRHLLARLTLHLSIGQAF
jgi:outer membrane protein insertion porin family/translocation and assembly module TamA